MTIRSLRLAASACLLITGVFVLPGCELVGGAIDNYKRDSTHEVKGEYRGLEEKSFAVVVAVDRSIQAEHPGLVDFLTAKMTERLSAQGNVPRAGGFVPADQVLKYLYNNPSWPTRPMADLAKALGGVQRLVYVEIVEYRLHEPGNAYEWEGVASGRISVIESDSPIPDDYAFDRTVAVKFPDKSGIGRDQIDRSTATSALAGRFIDRATWLMYDHQEPYYPEY